MLKVEIIGNLGSDAEIKIFNEKKYVSFSVAHSEKRVDANGIVNEKTTWLSVLKYGDGKNILQYLKKGTKVFVRGNLYAKLYNDQRGGVGVSLNVNADEIQLCGLKPVKQPNAQSQMQTGDIDFSNDADDLPY